MLSGRCPKIEQRAEKRRFEAERDRWTAQHGSADLRRAAGDGPPAFTAMYRSERVAIDLPGLWVDASGDVYHEACHSPTHRASGACATVARFLAARGVAAGTPEVVWVKTLPASLVDIECGADPRAPLAISNTETVSHRTQIATKNLLTRLAAIALA